MFFKKNFFIVAHIVQFDLGVQPGWLRLGIGLTEAQPKLYVGEPTAEYG